METADQRHCLFCSHPVRGRSDKKYCNDHCRNAYQNRLNSENTREVRNTIGALRRNRRILQEFLENKTSVTIPVSGLLQKGFQPGYHTGCRFFKDHHLILICFEYSFQVIADKIKIMHAKHPGG